MVDDRIEPVMGEDEPEGLYDKYYVDDSAEIRHHLQRLVADRSTLTVRVEGDTVNTASMALNVQNGGLWIDVPPTEEGLQAWLAAKQLRIEGSVNRALLRFSCGDAQLDSHDGLPAVRLHVPKRVMYLQRREFMRREPASGSLHCRLRVTGVGEVRATIQDIGGGGLAIITTRATLDLQEGDVLHDCKIELPDLGEVNVNLLVRHVMARSSIGHNVTQAGCEFVELEPTAQRKLYRYLLQLDREQMGRRGWDD